MYGPAIKNLIFDFGGVIINLHTDKTHRAFGALANLSEEAVKKQLTEERFFNEYEKGLLTDDEFRRQVRALLKMDAPDRQLDEAWNAMLGVIPKERLQLLQQLRKKHRVYLLSNTNNIHLQNFNRIVQAASDVPALDLFFDKAYYSHQLKMRKPDREIFDHVLSENELNPAETLFLDDNAENLRGAESAGMKTAHIPYPDFIFSVFS